MAADETVATAARAFQERPLRQQRRVLARLHEAAAREPASAAELRALWAALPHEARKALLAKPAGCCCGARAGAFGPRLTRACTRCGAELHAPCIGLASPLPRQLARCKRARTDAGGEEADGAEPASDGAERASAEPAPAEWVASCRCARSGAHAAVARTAAAGRRGARARPGAEAESHGAVAERVASLACGFGAAGLADADGAERAGAATSAAGALAGRLGRSARALLAAHARAWLRCLAAAAPPERGLAGLAAPLGAPLLGHYERKRRQARAYQRLGRGSAGVGAGAAQTGARGVKGEEEEEGEEEEAGEEEAEADEAEACSAGEEAEEADGADEEADAAATAALTAALGDGAYLQLAAHAHTSLERAPSAQLGREQLRAWLAPAAVRAPACAWAAWCSAASFALRDHIGEVVGAAFDTRSGDWPEVARLPLSSEEIEQALAALEMGPLPRLLREAADDEREAAADGSGAVATSVKAECIVKEEEPRRA